MLKPRSRAATSPDNHRGCDLCRDVARGRQKLRHRCSDIEFSVAASLGKEVYAWNKVPQTGIAVRA